MANLKIHEPDSDETIVSIPRKVGEELRVSLTTFNGHKFASLRVWATNKDGERVPTRKGCTVRLDEIGDVAGALYDIQLATGGGF
jgi:hypothetical protein